MADQIWYTERWCWSWPMDYDYESSLEELVKQANERGGDTHQRWTTELIVTPGNEKYAKMTAAEIAVDPELVKKLADLDRVGATWSRKCKELKSVPFYLKHKIKSIGGSVYTEYTIPHVEIEHFCNNCNEVINPRSRTHYLSPACRQAQIAEMMTKAGYEVLKTAYMINSNLETIDIEDDDRDYSGYVEYYLTGGQIGWLHENYATAYGKQYNHTTWVSKEVQQAVRQYLVGKASGAGLSLPKTMVTAGCKGHGVALLKKSSSICCVAGCSRSTGGDGLIAGGTTYSFCQEHSTIVLVALDKVLAEIKA